MASNWALSAQNSHAETYTHKGIPSSVLAYKEIVINKFPFQTPVWVHMLGYKNMKGKRQLHGINALFQRMTMAFWLLDE